MKTPVLVFGALVFGVGVYAQSTKSVVIAAGPAPKKAKKPDFNKDIRPILSEHCFRCHGPAAKEGQAGLRLDLQESATKDRHGMWAIKPGSAKNSEALARITSTDKSDVMPPADSGVKPLTPAEVATLTQWIDNGAQFKKHWAFIPPVAVAAPKVSNKKWCRNEIDPFILARLEEEGLKPAPEAPKETLLRRASLTLTGLSPTADELKRFLSDKSPKAYENAVDRLLASPRYGEHEARYWLDAVRYADTHGMHIDNERAIYPYRDWVVRAFNQDLPYDKFTQWQLAGDLLPHPTEDQMIASGYIRMNPTSNEGGAIEEEFLVRNTDDRVDTTSTVFLGLSVGCAKCHNHKYDPVTQKDYYSLFAFFNSTKDAPLDGNLFAPDPVMPAPTAAQSAEMASLNKVIDTTLASTDAETAKTWLVANAPVLPTIAKWTFAGPYRFKTFDEAYDTEVKDRKEEPIDIKEGVRAQFLKDAELANGYYHTTLTVAESKPLTLRVRSDDAVKVWLNGKLVHANKVLRGTDEAEDKVPITLEKGANDLLVKVANASGPNGFQFRIGTDEEVERANAVKMGKESVIKDVYLRQGPVNDVSKVYRAKVMRKAKLTTEIPQTLVAGEMPKPRQAYVLRRGEYNLREEKVGRAIPVVFGNLPADAPKNRLGLANWLNDPNNPLTLRVFVNRIWQQHFGTGIVKTAEDFGSQGEWPSHPELLDDLSVRFRKMGLSIKQLNRLIVTSATFRQASITTPQKEQKDPENRLCSRGPRFRLDAEVLRDQVLNVSGLLALDGGGRGFRPYQPAGLWEEVAFDKSVSTTAVYVQDMDKTIFRRSLYLFWKRTSPPPTMTTFDAPMREACVVRRSRTNTPLQALVTLNEPAFLEASRVFGERLVKSAKTDTDRLKAGFKMALDRAPSPKELTLMQNAVQRYRTRFGKNPADADPIISIGIAPRDKKIPGPELATWTLVANTLYNTDEFLTQH